MSEIRIKRLSRDFIKQLRRVCTCAYSYFLFYVFVFVRAICHGALKPDLSTLFTTFFEHFLHNVELHVKHRSTTTRAKNKSLKFDIDLDYRPLYEAYLWNHTISLFLTVPKQIVENYIPLVFML